MSELKFITDGTLGRLARWLRTIGYDTIYEAACVDRNFLSKAFKEGRVVLSRRRDLEQRNFRGRMIILRNDRVGEQIRELRGRLPELDISPERIFTRCVQCNALLEKVSSDSVKDIVPPYVFETQSLFNRCRSCGKIYWAGTHRERAINYLREVLN
jgi:uncharacterized protein